MVSVWTRDSAARDALALALDRFGYAFRLVTALEQVHDGATRVLVLGPSFTRGEARELRGRLPAAVAVVLLEDTIDPLPADVVAATQPVDERMGIPVRARSLRRVLQALLGS